MMCEDNDVVNRAWLRGGCLTVSPEASPKLAMSLRPLRLPTTSLTWKLSLKFQDGSGPGQLRGR